MYKKFDITSDSVYLQASEKYQEIINLTLGVMPDEPSRFIGGHFGEKPAIVKCKPEEDEKIMIVLLPEVCTQHRLLRCDQLHSMMIMGHNELCVMFIMRVTGGNAYAAFDQEPSRYKHEWHCFAWDGSERIFTTSRELELAMTNQISAPD